MSFIDKYSLVPGQWVFYVDDKESVPAEQSGPFKVICRDDGLLESCRCFLMNSQGELCDYCPRLGTLNFKLLPLDFTVKVINKKEINEKFSGKIETLQNRSIDLLKKLAESPYFGKGFNPDDETKTLSGTEIRAKYGLIRKD